MGRKRKVDEDAGKGLKQAYKILQDSCLLPSLDRFLEDWKNGPTTKKTFYNWCKFGIPEESGKVYETWKYFRFLNRDELLLPHDEMKEVLNERWIKRRPKQEFEVKVEEELVRDAETLKEITVQAKVWEESGFKYSIVEMNAEKYYVYLDEHSRFEALSDDLVKAFITLMALHKGNDWGYWIETNSNNQILLDNLARYLNIRYDRVKYRMLCCLQVFEKENLHRTLMDSNPSTPDQDPVLKYVCDNTVEEYLHLLLQGDTLTDPSKVKQVLLEMKKFWKRDLTTRSPSITSGTTIGGPALTSKVITVPGSACHVISGVASTLKIPNACSSGWFSGPDTVILGTGGGSNYCEETTKVSWTLPTGNLDLSRRWYLFIGCIRFFGGLHASRRGARVKISINHWYIDDFSLMVVPEHHSDFFHRIPTPILPEEWPVCECLTRYAWPILKDRVVDGKQVVAVEIDADVSWDIDYIALLCT